MSDRDGQQIETDAKAVAQGAEPGDVWLKKIKKAKKDEEAWRKDAEKAIAVFEADEEQWSKTGAKPVSFNIYHSNIETMVPAVYNSTPIPDIRRRFDDPDPIAKAAADVIERALSYTVDQYEFDGVMHAAVRGALIGGRGVVRVRYKPMMTQQPDPATQQPVDVKGYEEVICELVPWDRYIRGPARSWSEMPWIAFEHDLTQDEIAELADPETAEGVKMDGERGDKDDAKPDAGIYKTTKVYEVWDKKSATVFFLEDKKAALPLKVEPDPLQLPGFWPIPRPLQPLMRETSLTPICPYTVYASLLDELDSVTKRISKLGRQVRVRGIYDAELKADLQSLMNADDGTYLPAEDATRFAQGAGGLEKAIAHFPIEPTVLALRELYTQREQIKQTIYEVTGIADVVRGATEASETATAQQIKAQYAGLRVQNLQKEVARFARDIFRMKAALFCTHFSTENLSMMTGIDARQAEPILRSDAMRSFRIDIETDSTIRGDVTRSLDQINQFIQGTGAFVQSVGAMAQAVPTLIGPMMDVYAAFARKFDLGKQAEDALDKMPQLVQQFMQQQQAAQQQPSPEVQKAQIEAEARKAEIGHKQQAAQMDMQSKRETHMLELQHKTEAHQAEMQMKREAQSLDLKAKEYGAAIDLHSKRAATEFADHDRQGQLGHKQELSRIDMMKAEREAGVTAEGEATGMAKTMETVATALVQALVAIADEVKAGNEEVLKAVKAPKTVKVNRDKAGRVQGAVIGAANEAG